MKKKVLIFIVAAVLVVTLGLSLVACDKPGTLPVPKGMGVEKPVYKTADMNVEGTNLAGTATVAVNDNEADKGKLTDGSVETVWIGGGASAQITFTFAEATTFNTVVLKEDGNFITSFKFEKQNADGSWEMFYKQDTVEYYRYCTFDAVTATAFRIVVDEVRDGKSIRFSEIEVYNLGKKTYSSEFIVSNYYDINDYAKGFTEENKKNFDVITDQILFCFVYFNHNGELEYRQPDGSTAADQTHFGKVVDDNRAAIGDRNVRIVVSVLAGWSKDEQGKEYQSADNYQKLADTEFRNKLIDNIVGMLDRYNLDGADFDWEYPEDPIAWGYYGDFLGQLHDRIAPQGKYVSVALSNFNVGFSKEHIEKIDYVNIMGYDRFDYDGNQASFRSGAYNPMKYFLDLGFEKSQLLAGMPFYGRPTTDADLTVLNPTREPIWVDVSYPSLTRPDGTAPGYWDNFVIAKNWSVHYYNNESQKYDDIRVEDIAIWINSPAMVADKTAFAIEQEFAGIMVFRMFEDNDFTNTQRSNANAIYKTINERIAYAE